MFRVQTWVGDVEHTFEYGDTVVIPWGRDEVRGTAAVVYGRPEDRRVVIVYISCAGAGLAIHHRHLAYRPAGVKSATAWASASVREASR